MKPYSEPIELALGIAEFKRLGDLCDAARDACRAAGAEYQRKVDVPIIGLLYSMPAWRRYERAMSNYDEVFARFMAFSTAHIARLQAIPCAGMETPPKEMMQ